MKNIFNNKDNGPAWLEQWLPLAYPLVLGFVLAGIFLFHLSVIREATFAGYADPAAYGEVAANILSGRGPVQDFLDFYFTSYPHISHYTDHWYSLFTIILIPFIRLFGKSAFAIKLPVLISYALLVVSVYYLVKIWFDRRVALLTALTLALHPYVLEYAINGWPDIPFTLFIVGVLILYTKAERSAGWYVAAGLLAGLTCWLRVTGFLVLAGLVLHLLFFRWQQLKRSRLIWVGAMAFLIGFLPGYLYPSFTHQVASSGSHWSLAATMGYWGNPQEEHWQIFWREPPDLVAKIRREGMSVMMNKTIRELSGLVLKRNYFEENPPLWQLVSLPLFFLALWMLGRKYKVSPYNIILFICVIYIVTLAILFKLNTRYLFICQILLLAAGWRGVIDLLEKWSLENHFLKQVSTLPAKELFTLLFCLCLLAILCFPAFHTHLNTFGLAGSRFPYTDDFVMLGAFDMITRHTSPGEAVMCTLPWAFTFHTGRKSAMIPYGSMADIITICLKYNITHLADFGGAGRAYLADYPECIPRASFEHVVLYELDFSRGTGQGLFYQRSNWQLFEWAGPQ